jgi:hypothetical protein
MLAQMVEDSDFAYLISWQALAAGTLVASFVFVILGRYAAWHRRRLSVSSTEEDLPWEELLELLRQREHELAASGASPENDLPSEELLALLLASLPPKSARRLLQIPAEERAFLEMAMERRSGGRRWGNPTDVYLSSPLLSHRVHGIVINRSTGGLGIFVNEETQAGLVVEVRAVEAPAYVPAAEVEIKYCRKVRRQFILGCQFRSEIPWNVRVWFG